MKKVLFTFICSIILACSLETIGTDTSPDTVVQMGGNTSAEFVSVSGGQFVEGGSTGSGGSSTVSSAGGILGSGGTITSSSSLVSAGGILATGGSVIITQGGAVVLNPKVELASDTPLATSVSRGTASVPVLRIRFSGDLASSPVLSLQIIDIGTGHRADISGVYILDSVTGDQLSLKQPIVASSKILKFSGLSISEPTTVTFMADISTTATQNVTHAFELTNASYVELSDDFAIEGVFPIRGNSFMIIR